MRITQIRSLKLIICLTMFFTLTVSAVIVYAKTVYVSDQLIITMREGKGNEYKIIESLKTGTPLEIIEESEQYLKVRTDSGSEGWVLNWYVNNKTPKPEVISGLEQKVARMNKIIDQYKTDTESLQNQLNASESDLSKKITDLKQNLSSSKGTAEQTSVELNKITKKYTALLKNSKDVVNLVKERDGLKTSSGELEAATKQLQEDNDKLKRTQMIWWFIAGGGVFFVGWIVGKVSRQKRFY